MKQIKTPLEAYFLGWMYSDGCVFYNQKAYSYSTKIKLKLAFSEEKVLLLFLERFPFFTKGLEIDKQGRQYVYIMTYNREFAKDLINLGVLPNKSYKNKKNLKFPHFEDTSLYEYFIRGLFEGDGTFYLRKGKSLEPSIMMSNYNFLVELQSWININLSVSFKIREHRKNLWRLRLTKNDECKLFSDFLYKNYLDMVLERKYQIVLKYSSLFTSTKETRKESAKRGALKRKGKKFSAEARLNMSKSRIGKKLSQQQKDIIKEKRRKSTLKVEVFSKGESIGVYRSAQEIEELSLQGEFSKFIKTVNPKGRNGYPYYFLSNKNISACCKKRVEEYKGLKFKYIESVPYKKSDELLEPPKALSTGNSDNLKDVTMDNQQPS